jgi:hypothetical protein
MLSPKEVCKVVMNHKHNLAINSKVLDLLDGCLERYLLESLQRQLSPRAYSYAKERIVPINIFPRYVEKLTSIYQTGVVRDVQGGSESDTQLLGWYENQFDVDSTMHVANKLYNACGASLIHPYMSPIGPRLRYIQNDRFVVHSEDPINPTTPTTVILIAGKDSMGMEVYWVYDKESFRVIKSDETIDFNAMAQLGVPDGVNIYGVLPFVYVNKSPLRLVPEPDMDSIRMTEYVPIALTDLNLAAMFSSFAITYVINGTVENPVKSPNAMWFLKSDDPEKDVEIGTLKPEVDYADVLNLIQSEMSLWLGSKGIKSQSVGNLTQDNYASGIAKIIDEADTYDVRQQQTVFFGKAETQLWELVFRHMHPVWSASMSVENRSQFSPAAEVDVKFAVVPVGTQRSQLIADQKEEYAAGFTTRRRAIASLNPQMTMSQVDELIHEIEEEHSVDVVEKAPVNDNTIQRLNNGDEMATSEDTSSDSNSGPGYQS